MEHVMEAIGNDYNIAGVKEDSVVNVSNINCPRWTILFEYGSPDVVLGKKVIKLPASLHRYDETKPTLFQLNSPMLLAPIKVDLRCSPLELYATIVSPLVSCWLGRYVKYNSGLIYGKKGLEIDDIMTAAARIRFGDLDAEVITHF